MKAFLAACAALSACLASAETVWLDDLDLSSMDCGWSSGPRKDASIAGQPLRIGDRTFSRGVGVHAVSSYEVDCGGKAVAFDAMVGLDAEVTAQGSVKFIVNADGKRVAESPVMRVGAPPYALHADLSGANIVELLVSEANDGTNSDHADWCDARFTVAAGATVRPVGGDPFQPGTQASAKSAVGASMPTQAELDKAQPLVNELMRPYTAQLKARTLQAETVGDKAVEFADAADSAAARFLFLRGSIHYFARARAYDKAAAAIEAIESGFDDVSPDAILKLAKTATERAAPKDAPRLFAVRRRAESRVKCASARKTVIAQMLQNPGDMSLVRRHAELSAAVGEWDKALKSFVRVGGSVGQAAQRELDGSASSADIADFWWAYKTLVPEAASAIRARAASHYRAALDSNELDGLVRTLAEQRIAQAEPSDAPQSAAGAGPSGSETPANMKRGLVGYWPFDGDAKDASGKGNNGILRGVAPCEDRFGRANGAYRFDTEKFVEVPSSPSLQNITKAVTFTAWIRPSRHDNGYICIMQKGDQRDSQFSFQFGGGNLNCNVGRYNQGVWTAKANDSWRIKFNEWQHIAATYEKDGTFRYYKNGKLMGVGDALKEFPANRFPLFIGADPWGRREFFIGDMDDVRIYNRALSKTEIVELYNAESAPPAEK